jgi:abortive infection Abi-like protein
MEKLRALIEQHGRWTALTDYIDRIEGYKTSDFSLALENAKALLESIGKEICLQKKHQLSTNPSINTVLKSAFTCLGYSNIDMVNQISSSLATIGQQIGSLRNEISPTSHGKPLDDLEYRNDRVDLLAGEFLIDSTMLIAVLLIRTFENDNPRKKTEDQLDYFDADEFNDFWDETFGEFVIGEYSFPASEILFNVDSDAYKTEHAAFQDEKS